MFGEVCRNYLNVQLMLFASTDSHASFFSGAWKFVNFYIILIWLSAAKVFCMLLHKYYCGKLK